MAKVTIKMPDEFLEKLSKLGDKTDRIVDAVLEEGGREAVKYVKDGLSGAIGKDTKYPSRTTGELERGLGVSPPKLNRGATGRDVKIGFSESRPDGEVNAKLANILEYGKSGQSPKPFLKAAQTKARKPVMNAMEQKFDEEVGNI